MLSKTRVLCCIDAIYLFFLPNFKGFWEQNEFLFNQCQEIRIHHNLLKLCLRTDVQKTQRSNMKVVEIWRRIWFLKNIFKKFLEPNYLYSNQHKTLSFKKKCGIYCDNKNNFVSVLIYQSVENFILLLYFVYV